jgi:hypothetical protein
MPKRRRDTQALFDVPTGRKGRVERAVDAAIVIARHDGVLAEVDCAALTLARAQARGVDVAEAGQDVWALARIGAELRETLQRLRLDPTSRGGQTDDLRDFLGALGQPQPTIPVSPAPMGDGA